MVNIGTVFWLGLSQLICWGVFYYLIGVFGDLIIVDTGWSRTIVYGGFSVGLGVMALVSALTGRLIDRFGGGRVMAAGSVVGATGCVALASAYSLSVYYISWILIGLAMRMTLYDAAFAALARIGGPNSKRPMAQITLLGGLASTCFWPLGHMLADVYSWRTALIVFAAISLLTLPIHLMLPSHKYKGCVFPGNDVSLPHPIPLKNRKISAILYALIFAVMTGLNSGMSAHMIGLLKGLGLGAATAVTIASLRGVGQSSARLADVLFGKNLHPVDLNLMATLALPVCFTIGLAGMYYAPAVIFTFMYGAGNGIMSITRGTLPLVLFDLSTYGAFVGKLLIPSFIFSAISPILFALVMDGFGATGVMYLLIVLGSVIFTASLALRFLSLRT